MRAFVARYLPRLFAVGSVATPAGALVDAGKLILAINCAGFVVTAATCSHKITDLCGTSSFVATAAVLLARAGSNDRLSLLSTGVIFWGVRLGGYLFWRVLQTGEDKRLNVFFPKPGERWFDSKQSMFPLGLGSFWFLQALWAWVSLLPVVMASAAPAVPLRLLDKVSLVGMFGGIIYETVADYQKSRYKSQNPNHWTDVGLWKYSRYPNYFGEMVTWAFAYLSCLPALPKLSHKIIGLTSPLFVWFLLRHVSGVPPLEEMHEKNYGNLKAFQEYKANTPLLVPWKIFTSLFKERSEKKEL